MGAWLVFALACARALLFWANDPLLAYGNSFDQSRALAALGLAPDAPGVARFQETPAAPIRWFSTGHPRHHPYPSSDIALSQVYVAVHQALAPGDRLDIRGRSLCLLALLFSGAALALAHMMRAHPGWGWVYASWLLLVFDAINLLFLNTLYAEFLGFAALVGLVGVALVALSQGRLSRASAWWGLALLLLLATNRQQYAYLPLVAVPLGWCLGRPLRAPGPVLLGLLAMALPALMYHQKSVFDSMRTIGQANRVDTVLEAMLPAASDREAMLRRLGLRASCEGLAGRNWYHGPSELFHAQCPEVLDLPRSRYLMALAADPAALARMTLEAIERSRGFVATQLGHVEGRSNDWLISQPGPNGWTIDLWIRRLPPPAWATLFTTLALAPALLAAWAWHRRHKPGWVAGLALTLGLAYVFYTALLGDGYVEFSRHAVLFYSLGTLSLLWLLASPWCWRRPHPSTSTERPLPA